MVWLTPGETISTTSAIRPRWPGLAGYHYPAAMLSGPAGGPPQLPQVTGARSWTQTTWRNTEAVLAEHELLLAERHGPRYARQCPIYPPATGS